MINEPSWVMVDAKPGHSIWEKLVLLPLKHLKTGQLTIKHGSWQSRFGSTQSDLKGEIQVLDDEFYRAVFKGGSIGAAESYMDGHWTSPDLTAVIQLMAANDSALNKIEQQTSWLKKLALKLVHLSNRNSLAGSKRNILAHYDLSNAFYEIFLDPTMMYSSAVYPTHQSTLEQASLHKLRCLCEPLQLTSDDHLLEIGTGWGTLACYAAKEYGCKVTTTTISDAQYDFALNRIREQGLEGQVILLKKDYRELTGQYDKLISIEMIEAVGHQHLPKFFEVCSSLLKPGGKMALQAITIADQREANYRKQVDFIQRYIFPGGYLPSIAVLAEKVAAHSQLAIRSLEDIGLHYAKTLKDWRNNFESQTDKVKQLGFDERFIRMWRYYLCYCEGGFRQKVISTVQIQLEKAHLD